MSSTTQRPDLSSLEAIANLPDRKSPYWTILEYCRHLGIQKVSGKPIYWLARIRRKDGGYTQTRLSEAINHRGWTTNPVAALGQARQWFDSYEIARLASAACPVGGTKSLKYVKKTPGFTVGDAMHDYVEWKRIAATRSHFESNLSLINHHIIPHLGDVEAKNVTSRAITAFCQIIIETPPKRGQQKQKARVSIDTLDAEQLRKRKKTVNTLLGILRLALRMAWENGEVESERCWRSIHRLPNVDVPRQIFLTRPQCRLLIKHCRADLADLVRAALYTGCRVSELVRMRVGDVGAGIFGIYVRPGKNGRGRYVFLPTEGMLFFLELSKNRDVDDLVFRLRSGRAWGANHKHLFKNAVRDASLPAGLVFHSLRHTYASQLVQAGTPLAVVAKQLGHSNTDTVSRTYGHLCCDSIETHLARGFARLEQNVSVDEPALVSLRKKIALGETRSRTVSSWPKSNFSLAQFTGPRN